MKICVEACNRWVCFCFLGKESIAFIRFSKVYDCFLGWEETERWKKQERAVTFKVLWFLQNKIQTRHLRPLIIRFLHSHTLNFCLLILRHSLFFLFYTFFTSNFLLAPQFICIVPLAWKTFTSPYLILYSFLLKWQLVWIHFPQMKIMRPFAKL